MKSIGFLKWPNALGVAVLAFIVGVGAEARGDLLSSEDRVQLLYSNRFIFDKRGVPLMRVNIMDGKSSVVLTAKGGLELLPSGPGGASVTGGKSWELRIGKSKKADVHYWTVLRRKPGTAGTWGRREIKYWKARGVEVKLFEVGSVFAVSGTVVDNRTTLVACSPKKKFRDARSVAVAMEKKYNVKTGLHAELVERSKGVIVAENKETGVRVRNEGMLWLAPRQGGHVTVKKVEYGKGYSWHGFADRSYWGMVYVAVDRKGKLAVVNAVAADRLLAGLVPAEIYPSAPIESLKAQAVAARGQLFAKLGKRHLADPYPLCAAQHCQVYSGAGKEHARTTRAVKDTRGLILMDAKGRLADTVYHSNCGGHTEHNEKVWHTSPRENLRGRADLAHGRSFWHEHFKKGKGVQGALKRWLRRPPKTYCFQFSKNKRSLFRWKETRSVKRLTALAGRPLGVGTVTGIQVLKRGVSGRAVEVMLKGNRGKTTIKGELNIRRRFGNLKSSMFIVRAVGKNPKHPESLKFEGGGWGHGVGMCQTGAMGMAKAGKKLRDILSFYYRKTKLIRLY